jgi:anti-sigma regulatory factor (Ser/Thr protein kinase)
MSTDEIALTLPADEAFHGVAHLVLGGLAVRLDLTMEVLEELELAIDALLERCARDGEDEVQVRLVVGDDHLRATVGPFPASMRTELETETVDTLDLRRILRAVSDDVDVSERDGGTWVELTKQIERAEDKAS